MRCRWQDGLVSKDTYGKPHTSINMSTHTTAQTHRNTSTHTTDTENVDAKYPSYIMDYRLFRTSYWSPNNKITFFSSFFCIFLHPFYLLELWILLPHLWRAGITGDCHHIPHKRMAQLLAANTGSDTVAAASCDLSSDLTHSHTLSYKHIQQNTVLFNSLALRGTCLWGEALQADDTLQVWAYGLGVWEVHDQTVW